MAHKPHHVEAQKLSKITIKEFGALFRKSVLIFLLITVHHLLIGQPVLLKGPETGTGATPVILTKVGPLVFFSVGGNSLWKTDGTVTGTTLVKTLPTGSIIQTGNRLGQLNNQLFFMYGNNLWKSDGTENGTIVVADIQSLAGSVFIQFLGATNSKIFFKTNSSLLGYSDGTSAGTVITSISYDGTQEAIVIGEKLYFGNGNALYVTDGLTQTQLRSFPLWPIGLGPVPTLGRFNEYNGRLIFAVFSGIHNSISSSTDGGIKLWITDGTIANTNYLINPVNLSNPGPIVDHGPDLQYSGNYKIGNKIYYNRAFNATSGQEPFVYDGVNVSMVKDIAAGNASSGMNNFYDGGSHAYTFRTDLVGNLELWKSDGTDIGTSLVKTLSIFTNSGGLLYNYVPFGKAFNSSFIFSRDQTAESGLWRSDGTSSGTGRIALANIGTEFFIIGSNIIYMQGNSLYAINGQTKFYQEITFNGPNSQPYGSPNFNLTGTASSGLPITYTSSNTNVASISGNTVTIVGVGSTTITATQVGDATFAAATPVTRSFSVQKASQTITFNSLEQKVFGDPTFDLTATASSGLAVAYSSSNTNVATISGSTVTIVGAGTTMITASQAGNTNYFSASSVQKILTVNKADQTITFGTLASRVLNDPSFSLSATSTSGLTVSYTSSNPAVASVSGNTVTITGVGTTNITASQAGNNNYNAASEVVQLLTVNSSNKQAQTITFNTLAPKTIGDAPFVLTATASSGLPVTYTCSNTAVATVSGNTVTIVGVGTTNITASQAGDATYNPAPNVIQTLTVNSNGKQAQTITFNALPTKTIGEAPFALTGTASSGLPVSYTSSNPAVATVTGSAVTLVGVGTTIITASQGGDATYNPAISVPQTLVVQSPKLFNYSKYILASNPSTLTANVQSKNATTGEVSINGSDSQGPNTPFTFLWGDNTSSSAFFPATHTYVDKTKNYVASVIANYPNNQKDTVQVLINFVPYTINPVALDPKTKVIIPSTAFTFAGTRLYTPPANLTSFADNAFTSFTRSQTEYILSVASYIGYDFVNNDAFLYNGKFEQYMLSDPSFGGAYSIWYTNPVGFGVGNGFLGNDVDFSSLVHEMGHNYTLNMPASFYYGGRIDGNANAIFSEAMAQMFQHAVGYELINNYKLAGLGEDVQFKLKEKFINSVKLVKNSYTNYVNGGKVFKSWNDPGTPADETFNTFMTIAYKFIERAEQEGKGYRDPFKRMITTLQKFNATYAQLYDQQNNNSAADAFRSTLMVAAVSSAFQKDLRPDFIALNFPINNNIFDQLYGVPDIVVKQGTATISTNGIYDFGSVIIPSNSGDVIFSVQNPGTAVLVVDVSASTLTGANASDFSIDLSQSQSGIFKVRFTPSAGGVRNAQLSIVNNVVGKSPYIINFTGTGVSTKSNQTITFNTLPAKTFGEAPFTLEATASSLLPVSYTSSNAAVATLSGNIVTITGAGTTTITASQDGNETYNAATSVDQTLIVNKASQTILFNSLSAKYEGAGPFTLTATGGGSGLPITFISSNPNVATISGDTVTIIAVGTTNITASQAGNANYEAAAEVSQPFTVNPKENQTITFEVSDKILGDGSFQLTATASSNLAVAYATPSDKITINGNQVTLVKAGRTSIIASQAGNAEFNPAPSVERLFCIKPSKPLITASGFNTEAVTLTSSAAAGNQWYKDGLVIPGATNATLSAIAFGIYKVQVTADDCVSEFSADFPIIVTGDLPPKVSAVTISPNPVEDVLEIRGLEGGVNDFQLTDLTGRIASVELERNSSSFSISVKHLTQGMYILHAQTDSGLYQIKFIKK